jgi:ferritin-like protein
MAEQQVVKYGDVTQRVGVEVVRARGVDVEKLIKMLATSAAAEFAGALFVISERCLGANCDSSQGVKLIFR